MEAAYVALFKYVDKHDVLCPRAELICVLSRPAGAVQACTLREREEREGARTACQAATGAPTQERVSGGSPRREGGRRWFFFSAYSSCERGRGE